MTGTLRCRLDRAVLGVQPDSSAATGGFGYNPYLGRFDQRDPVPGGSSGKQPIADGMRCVIVRAAKPSTAENTRQAVELKDSCCGVEACCTSTENSVDLALTVVVRSCGHAPARACTELPCGRRGNCVGPSALGR
jgi:hypothetical protein